MIWTSFLGLFVLITLSSCKLPTEVPNTTKCAVAGTLLAGMNCAETQTDKTKMLNFSEAVEFLEPRPERIDPKDPSKKIPAKGPAVCQSLDDETKEMIAMEQMCRKLKEQCTTEVKDLINKKAKSISKIDGI